MLATCSGGSGSLSIGLSGRVTNSEIKRYVVLYQLARLNEFGRSVCLLEKNIILVKMPKTSLIPPPIAMLHSVTDTMDDSLSNWCISRKAFIRLLDHLERRNIQTTHFAEMIGKGKPSNSVILTFDDCYKHLLDFAVPELVKRGMKAAFYMPTAHMGQYNSWDIEKGTATLELMNAGDLKALSDEGMEVGPHSHHHIELKEVVNEEKIKKELTISKQIIEDIIQKQVYSFAYPFGSIPNNYRRILAGTGYQYAVGIYHPLETRLALRRFGIYEKDTEETLDRKLSSRYRWFRRVYDVVKKY
jgi:peptidoglycan/xylan/chitin deacetylase (PgdA/CDA1 family)